MTEYASIAGKPNGGAMSMLGAADDDVCAIVTVW